MATDRLTNLTTAWLDRDRLATKQISMVDDEWQIEDYDHAKWWSARQIDVHDLVSLGKALTGLERDPHSCVIRGEPIEGINLARCRRLKDPDPDGTPPSFAPAARHWLGIDVDTIPVPIWDPEKLARRRVALERDCAEHGTTLSAADLDPEPIDPAKDWAIVIRAAVITLPVEFHDTSCYWQMTSGAGIKPGIRLRLWYWLDRPVADDEAKRWLEGAPVDSSIYGAVAIHYTARPVFSPPKLNPVPLRGGFWWRHRNTVPVSNLTPPPEPKPHSSTASYKGNLDPSDRAQRYAKACIDAVIAAEPGIGKGRSMLLAIACKLYGMANKGLLSKPQITAELKAAMANRQWDTPQKKAEGERILAWAEDHADTTLPEGFR